MCVTCYMLRCHDVYIWHERKIYFILIATKGESVVVSPLVIAHWWSVALEWCQDK